MLNYVLNAFLNSWLIARAYPHDIFCSKNEVSWKEAMTYCIVANGQPMSFHGIEGKNIENINIRPDVTVWTSDFFYLNGLRKEPCLCSFQYFTEETFYESSDDLFSYCNDFKYYFCRKKTSNVIEVLNNTWEYATKCDTFSRYELKLIVKPGYYWKRKTAECGSDGFAANSSSGTSLRPDLYNDSCFLETNSVANVSPTKSFDIFSSSTLRHARGSANENAEDDTEAGAGTIAGIVVGVCSAALAGGIVLFIFIQGRYRYLFDKTTTSNSLTQTIKATKTQPNKTKAHTLFNNIGYDTSDDNQKQNNTKQSKRNNTEISNDAMSSINQLRTAVNEEPYYNQTNSAHVTDLTDQQTTEESSYSFAVETENNVRENEMSQNEYDTTISSRKGVCKTENVYNKIEPVKNSSDVYDSTVSQMQSSETDDVYNKLTCKTNYGKIGTSLSNNEDYDSVVYTLKNQNIQQCTDNAYN